MNRRRFSDSRTVHTRAINSKHHVIPSVVLDDFPSKAQKKCVSRGFISGPQLSSLNSHAAQGEHRSNILARGAHHPPDAKHSHERGIVDDDGLMRNELQKTSLCAARSVVVSY